MGKELFEKYNGLVQLASGILGYSIADLCLYDKDNNLGKTQYTQPALYVVNTLSYLDYNEKNPADQYYVVGHSLGEYNALLAAGVFDFETGLRIVMKRAALFSNIKSGGMLAVIDCPDAYTLEKILLPSVDVANYNSDRQVILSGLVNDLKLVEQACKENGIKSMLLNVNGPFHSRYMAPVKQEFHSYLTNFTFKQPVRNVVSNYNSVLYGPNNITDCLTQQIASPVQWKQAMYLLFDRGVTDFVELGPGKVLSKLLVVNQECYASKAAACRPGHREDTTLPGIVSSLGSKSFKSRYRTPYAYVAGGMYKGISSENLVTRMANAGFLSFLGSGGLAIQTIEASIDAIRKKLQPAKIFGINFLHNPLDPDAEVALAALLIKKEVRIIEASAFANATAGLVFFRLKGLRLDEKRVPVSSNFIIAKLSRPEVASVFLSPPPVHIVENLVRRGLLSQEEGALAPYVSLASDITIEADSGGHTDRGVAFILIPAIAILRDQYTKRFNYTESVHIGAAGGIGTPSAIAAAFMMGVDYVLTGSVNQCTVEAGTSHAVKDLLSQMNIQDTAYAPAGDMFELGAKVQVLKKGVLFPNRANKLFELYKNFDSLEDIDLSTRTMLEEKYFGKTIADVWNETRQYLLSDKAELLQKIESSPKLKMAALFKWYFHKSTQYSLEGNIAHKMDFQIHCGAALGSFNQWVAGTELENWEKRHVDEIALKLLSEAQKIFDKK
ncbi:MAG: PfaD family polyunsaturated fatty acid/polyketide biosynthesis protein [Williamsia sp.]|nr:PfaD family polyunsaturated fatty acid/polyketide biosynthesis protein [Williamsia sp.]